MLIEYLSTYIYISELIRQRHVSSLLDTCKYTYILPINKIIRFCKYEFDPYQLDKYFSG